MTTRCIGTLLVLIAVSLVPFDALAIPDFPPKVQEVFEMPCEPVCTLCHATMQGMAGTVVAPFGERYYALQLLDTGDLESIHDVRPVAEGVPNGCADAGVDAKGNDADCDGISDVEELMMGEDPNDPSPGASVCADLGVAYGCIGSIVPRTTTASRSPDGPGTAVFAAFAALVVLAVRRRRYT